MFISIVYFSNCYSQIAKINSVNTSSSLWTERNAADGNINTIWSSKCRLDDKDKEFIQISTNTQKINYIKLLPRYCNSSACGFPNSFNINYLVGNKWVTIRKEIDFPKAKRNEYIILPFSNTIKTNSIKVETIVLGKDDVNNNVFQLSEILVGYEPDFENNFAYIGNNSPFKSQGSSEIQNVGSATFNPDKLKVWHFDSRKPLISAKNIYAPSVVKNKKASYNIYYGGWDFANSNNDNIYMTKTVDNFLSFGSKHLVVSNVPYRHANNSSAIKTGFNKWKMLYTSYPHDSKNKPLYGTSTDGLNWDFNHPITMNGYLPWADVNSDGGNVLYYEKGLYHLFFTDYNRDKADFRVHHATSSDFINYNYAGVAQNIDRIATDMKKFTFQNQNYYLLGTHRNTSNVILSLSKDINSFDNPLFSISLGNSPHIDDKTISTLGFVTDNNRLQGILYGASSNGKLSNNKIYANWLQKKVIFKNDHIQWGDIEEAYGPDRVELFMNTKIETGKFYIYDSDGTTLLYISPLVTLKSGDVWSVISNSQLLNKNIEEFNYKIIGNTEDNNYIFYPNPAKNKIYFNEEIERIIIYNQNGNLIKNNSVNSKEVDISDLLNDSYFMKIITKAGSIYSSKLLKE